MSNEIKQPLNGNLIIIDKNNGVLLHKEDGELIQNYNEVLMAVVEGTLVLKLVNYQGNCRITFDGWEAKLNEFKIES